MKLDCFEEVKRLTSEMVAIPSINKEPHGETAVARYVYNYFMDLPYFKAHPEQVICFQTKDDFVERHSTLAYVKGTKGTSNRTVILIGHIDTVGVDDFGTIREYAFKTDELPQKLKETFSLAPEVLADIESGDYMFGRGALDMKSGVAGHMYLVKASLNRITELLDAPIDVADRPGVQELQNPQGSVEFRHLTFRYPDGEYDVLQDISFTIHPGESVGIVGKTGAGKTALVDLLLRTYNVPDGTLFVDGKDVNTLSIHSVRAACAYVPQDNFLFSDTIAHNIGFGVDDASPEMIDHAASLADVRDNIVDFKDGYETVLGERGVTVSGGQKQRISIARALLKDAPILILDDSVSAVDTRTEKIILDNLKSSRANKTTLLIAHRISTVERLDKIIFLDDGKIEAVGPHDELYTSCPKYRRMVDLQRLEDEAGGDDNA